MVRHPVAITYAVSTRPVADAPLAALQSLKTAAMRGGSTPNARKWFASVNTVNASQIPTNHHKQMYLFRVTISAGGSDRRANGAALLQLRAWFVVHERRGRASITRSKPLATIDNKANTRDVRGGIAAQEQGGIPDIAPCAEALDGNGVLNPLLQEFSWHESAWTQQGGTRHRAHMTACHTEQAAPPFPTTYLACGSLRCPRWARAQHS